MNTLCRFALYPRTRSIACIRPGTLTPLTRAAIVFALPVVTGCQLASAQTVLGGRLIVQTTDPVIATYLGNTASYTNDLYLYTPTNSLGRIFRNQTDPVGSTFNLGTFPVGTELIFRLYVTNTNENFFSGPAELNPDNQFHARVTYNFGGPNVTRVEFEDLFDGPFNYNDLTFTFTNVPTPSAAALLGLGWAAVSRRKR